MPADWIIHARVNGNTYSVASRKGLLIPQISGSILTACNEVFLCRWIPARPGPRSDRQRTSPGNRSWRHDDPSDSAQVTGRRYHQGDEHACNERGNCSFSSVLKWYKYTQETVYRSRLKTFRSKDEGNNAALYFVINKHTILQTLQRETELSLLKRKDWPGQWASAGDQPCAERLCWATCDHPSSGIQELSFALASMSIPTHHPITNSNKRVNWFHLCSMCLF